MDKIEIKSHIDGNVLFSLEKENNTIKDTVEEAVKQHVSLYGAGLSGTDLSGAQLNGAILIGANLKGANLSNAIMIRAILTSADLSWSNLSGSVLYGAIMNNSGLVGAKCTRANFKRAAMQCINAEYTDFGDAELDYADLLSANLKYAKLNNTWLNSARLSAATLNGCYMQDAIIGWGGLDYADLSEAENIPYYPMFCPSDGAFIGWKKLTAKVAEHFGKYLVKLRIPEDAQRSSGTSMKCRCDKAEVLEIVDIKTGEHVDEVFNDSFAGCTYKVGEIVYPDSFDENRWEECSHGIHFFINKQDALDY